MSESVTPEGPSGPTTNSSRIIFQCPSCGHRIAVPAELTGQMGKCRNCGQHVIIPDSQLSPAACVPELCESQNLTQLGNASTRTPVPSPDYCQSRPAQVLQVFAVVVWFIWQGLGGIVSLVAAGWKALRLVVAAIRLRWSWAQLGRQVLADNPIDTLLEPHLGHSRKLHGLFSHDSRWGFRQSARIRLWFSLMSLGRASLDSGWKSDSGAHFLASSSRALSHSQQMASSLGSSLRCAWANKAQTAGTSILILICAAVLKEATNHRATSQGQLHASTGAVSISEELDTRITELGKTDESGAIHTEPEPPRGTVADSKTAGVGHAEPEKHLSSTGLDPIVAMCLEEASTQYAEHGFQSTTFGARQGYFDQREKLKPALGESPYWFRSQSQQLLFFWDSALRGLVRTYGTSGDTDVNGYARDFVALFGRPKPEDVFTVPKGTIGHIACPQVLVEYCFGQDGKVRLQVFDKQWLTEVYNRHSAVARASLSVFRRVALAAINARVGHAEGFPTAPGLKITFDVRSPVSPDWLLFYFAEEIYANPPDRIGTLQERSREPKACGGDLGISFIAARMERDSSGAMNGSMDIAVRFYNAPNTQRSLLRELARVSGTKHYLTRINSALVQEVFPPEGDTLTVRTSPEGIQQYEWRTDDDWQVTVDDNDMVGLRRSKRRL